LFFVDVQDASDITVWSEMVTGVISALVINSKMAAGFRPVQGEIAVRTDVLIKFHYGHPPRFRETNSLSQELFVNENTLCRTIIFRKQRNWYNTKNRWEFLQMEKTFWSERLYISEPLVVCC
jgi:hypothetical protein